MAPEDIASVKPSQISERKKTSDPTAQPVQMAPPTDEENSPLLSSTLYDGDDEDEDDDDDDFPTVSRQSLKQRIAQFIASKTGHYCVLALVSLDIASIVAALIVRLLACEGCIRSYPSVRAEHALDIVGLTFSCLFVVELGVRVISLGWAYFRSWFNCLDAMAIGLSLAVSVLLEGVLGKIASLAVALRLLRVFRIIDEVGVGAEERMEGLREEIAFLIRENESLRGEMMHLRAK
jgi:hypothetical protein